MSTQAALLTTAGVLVRANTSHGMNIGLIELATKHGWTNGYYDNAELAAAGRARSAPSPAIDEQLIRGGREAQDWLTAFAVPKGYELVEIDDGIVLRLEGKLQQPAFRPQWMSLMFCPKVEQERVHGQLRYADHARPAPQVQAQSGPVIFTEGHHFRLNGQTSVDDLAAQITATALGPAWPALPLRRRRHDRRGQAQAHDAAA